MQEHESDKRAGDVAGGKPYLSSSEAVERLGISKSTLYAYVSRGLIRSEPVPDSPRQRRYRADDVERLVQRQRMRSDPETATASTLDWGAPVLETSISLIVDEHLYFRGHDATTLARERSFEDVVRLLWCGVLNAELPEIDPSSVATRRDLVQRAEQFFPVVDPLRRMQSLLPLLEQAEPSAYDTRPEATMRAGAAILQFFSAVILGVEGHSGFARTLQAHWAPGRPELERLLDAALVLCADHELNLSTFTVRCVASAGAPLHSAVTAGIAAIRGGKHGGATLQAEALVGEIEFPAQAMPVLRSRLERGESLPGFGHRLYPNGDPRARALLDLMRELLPSSATTELATAITDAARQLNGAHANVDLALVLLCRELERGDGAAMTLMTLGRTAGWVAHAMEEYERNQLIRPRARYAESASDDD
jgi:citrate synthase